MTDLIVKNLQPSEKTKILLEGTLFGFSARTAAVEITAPPACPRMNVVKTEYTPVPGKEKKTTGNTFGFNRYIKGVTEGSSYSLILYFSTKTAKSNLKVGDQIVITAGDAGISTLNNKTVQVIANGILTDGGSFIKLRVPTSFGVPSPTKKSVSPSTNSVTEFDGMVSNNKFTVTIPNEEVFQKLINAKQNVSGVSDWIVRDIPIYAYRNYDGKIRAQDKLKLMFNPSSSNTPGTEEIKDSAPPAWSPEKQDALLVPSYSAKWLVQEKPNYNFYVTIARYTKKNGEWKGEWLQVNSAKKPIWSKAVKSSGN